MSAKILNFPVDKPLKERIRKTYNDTRHKFTELNFQYSLVYKDRAELPKWRIFSRLSLSIKLRRLNKFKAKLLSHMITLNELMIQAGYFGERMRKRPK